MSKWSAMAALMAAFMVTGCAFGGAQAPTPEEPQSVLSASSLGTAPEVVEVWALWDGVRCTNPEEAEKKLTAVLAKNPQHTQALALRGLARSEMGQREPAFTDMTEALRQEPTAQMYAWRAFVLWRNANPRGAERDAVYALGKSPGLPLAFMAQGLALKEQGRMSEVCSPLKAACAGGQCFGLETVQKEGLCK